LLIVVQNDVVQHHFDLIDLLIVDLYHVNYLILFVNHEPLKFFTRIKEKKEKIYLLELDAYLMQHEQH
jgi:hypothetical protein